MMFVSMYTSEGQCSLGYDTRKETTMRGMGHVRHETEEKDIMGYGDIQGTREQEGG